MLFTRRTYECACVASAIGSIGATRREGGDGVCVCMAAPIVFVQTGFISNISFVRGYRRATVSFRRFARYPPDGGRSREGTQMRPSAAARWTAWARVWTLSFQKMLFAWDFTVSGAMNNRRAICRIVHFMAERNVSRAANAWSEEVPTSALLTSSAGLGWSTISAELRSHGVSETPLIVHSIALIRPTVTAGRRQTSFRAQRCSSRRSRPPDR
jgi:hypothetical protein